MHSKDNKLIFEKYICFVVSENENLQATNNAFVTFIQELIKAGVGKNEAAKALIEQLQMIREQLVKEREIDNYQKLQAMLAKHLVDLKNTLKNDPKLIETFNNSVKKYVSSKQEQLEEASGIRENIESKAHTLRLLYTDMGLALADVNDNFISTTNPKGLRIIQHMNFINDSTGSMRDRRKRNQEKREQYEKDLERWRKQYGEANYVTNSSTGDMMRKPSLHNYNLEIDWGSDEDDVRGVYNFLNSLENNIHGYDWLDKTPKSYLDNYLNFIHLVIQEGRKQKHTIYNKQKQSKVDLTLNKLVNLVKDFASHIKEINNFLNAARILIKKTQNNLITTLEL